MRARISAIRSIAATFMFVRLVHRAVQAVAQSRPVDARSSQKLDSRTLRASPLHRLAAPASASSFERSIEALMYNLRLLQRSGASRAGLFRLCLVSCRLLPAHDRLRLLGPNPAFFRTDAMHLLRERREFHLFAKPRRPKPNVCRTKHVLTPGQTSIARHGAPPIFAGAASYTPCPR